MNPRSLFLALAIFFLCAALDFVAVGQTTSQARLPVPEPAARTAAEKDVRELYKEEYKVQSEDGRRTLAMAMLKQADSHDVKDDPASRYVLLRDARNAALDAGDFRLARAAVDAAVLGFDVDAFDARFQMLSRAFKTVFGDAKAETTDEDTVDTDKISMATNLRTAYQQELALHWLLLVDDALKAGRVPVAEKAASQAALTAGRTDNMDLQNAARTATNKIESSGDLAKLADALKAKLSQTPDDPDINLALGKYYCFVKDDWDTGRPFLMKGSDLILKALVQRDMDASGHPSDPMALAEDWWKFSAEATDKIGPISGKGRAVYWYRQQMASLPALKKATAEKRIADFDSQSIAPDHGVVIDVLALIDLKTVQKKGDWVRGQAGISCTKNSGEIFAPYSPPEEYDIYMDFTRDTGKEKVDLAFPMAKGWGDVVFGTKGNREEGITDASVKWAIRSGKKRGIENNTLYHTVLKVRKGSVSAFVNGEMIAKLQTNGKGMTVMDIPLVANLPGLRLSTYLSTATFNSVMALEVTGQGKVIAAPTTQPTSKPE